MQIRLAGKEDRDLWLRMDPHATAEGFSRKVAAGSGYVLWQEGTPAGLLHYSVLWDRLPFLNLLYVLEEHRGRGYGTQAMAQWEEKMKEQGYPMVLLSTQVDENAQHFYRKLGYEDCGGLLLGHTPLEQPMELFLRKVL